MCLFNSVTFNSTFPSVVRFGLRTEEQSGGVRKDFPLVLEMSKSKLLFSSWTLTGETVPSVLCGHAKGL